MLPKDEKTLFPFFYKEFFAHLFSNTKQIRNEAWQHSNQELREIKGNTNYWPPLRRSRREEVFINRL